MKRVAVLGIGAGDPEYMTVQAIKALNRADVFFVVDKGPADPLLRLRQEICDRYLEDPSAHRFVHVDDPVRDRQSPEYRAAVEAWREQRVDLFERLVDEEVADGETGAFLVWGDPSLYDGTILVLDAVLARGRVDFDYEVVPGISSVSALAARHRTPLNGAGESILITPARRLGTGLPDGVENVVVMLDRSSAFAQVTDAAEIFWGAYLGMGDEMLESGPLHERAGDIERIRAEAKERHGWMFDTYLLRRTAPG